MRGEVVRCFYVFRVDEFGAVGKSAISSIGLDPTTIFRTPDHESDEAHAKT